MPPQRSWWRTWPPVNAPGFFIVFGLMQRTKWASVSPSSRMRRLTSRRNALPTDAKPLVFGSTGTLSASVAAPWSPRRDEAVHRLAQQLAAPLRLRGRVGGQRRRRAPGTADGAPFRADAFVPEPLRRLRRDGLVGRLQPEARALEGVGRS